ncbi:MAG: spermidine/putrescine ABC transporter substrate-binding protein [Anaerolineae bacterium]
MSFAHHLSTTLKPRLLKGTLAALLLAGIVLLAGCAAPEPVATPETPTLADTLTYYDWDGYMDPAVLEAFTEEFGVEINAVVYESQEEAIANMEAGEVYDVVVMENRFISSLIDKGLLAPINYQNVPNIKNISPNFLDLAYDPGNRYTVPYTWGIAGLLYNTELVEGPVTSWMDQWDPAYAGRVGLWRGTPRETLGMALMALGYSANSEDPAELEEALALLLELKPDGFIYEEAGINDTCGPQVADGEVAITLGWSYDLATALESSDSVAFIIPEEGGMLWGDNLVIPANSPNKYTAEVFINYLMRPEVNAQITNYTYSATANQAAIEFVDPEILQDTSIFPTEETIRRSEIILPLSAEGEALHTAIWERFLAGD